MTPEEKFNQEVWEMLQKIEAEKLVTEEGKPVEYKFPIRHFAGVGIIPQERQKKIIYKLQEWGALQIREDPFDPPASTQRIFYLNLIQPKFGEIYKKFKKACDINSYLNDFQQKLLNKEKKPKFSQLKTIKPYNKSRQDRLKKDFPKKANWSKSFKWQKKVFIFGKYGEISFNSKIRIALFKELAKEKGSWVTVRKLKEITEKDDSYVRPTIGQIEKSMKPNLRQHISIPSTNDDYLQPKPVEGAYRIKFTS